jgi:mRNA-degrading endonuclease toxin of MazEF toxin-antitoxin module
MPAFPYRGEVYFALLPDEEKERPAVVLSINTRNERANDVIVVPVTSNLTPAPTHVELPAGEGGLRQDSMARCEQVSTLPKSWLGRGPLGPPLSLMRMMEIERAVMRAIGVPTP